MGITHRRYSGSPGIGLPRCATYSLYVDPTPSFPGGHRVSRHTLWRFLRRGHTGRALPRAVMGIVGDSVEVLEAAIWDIVAAERLVARRPAAKPVLSPYPLITRIVPPALLDEKGNQDQGRHLVSPALGKQSV